MTHVLFKLLDDFNLIKSRNRLNRIISLQPSDFTLLIDKLEESIPRAESRPVDEARPFELWLPYSSQATLSSVPSYLFLFDNVYLLDPLYDLCVWLEMEEAEVLSYNLELLGEVFNLNLYDDTLVEIRKSKPLDLLATDYLHQLRVIAARRLDKIISSYLEYRELIEEGVFILYINPTVGYDAKTCLYFAALLHKESLPPHIVDSIALSLNQTLDNKLLTLRKVFLQENNIALWMEMYQFFITSSVFKSLFPSKSLNIDLGDEGNKHTLDKVIQLGASLLGDNVHLLHGIKWPRPEDELIIPSLTGIPAQELLSIRQKEKAAIESFRYKTQKKLLDIRATTGTDDYSSLLRSLQTEQKGQIAEVELLAEHIKRDHLRKIAHQIGIVTLSAAGAILSASATIKDPLTLIGVGIGGAGLSAGISKLVETWISYQAETDKLKEKDSYILWKMLQRKRRR